MKRKHVIMGALRLASSVADRIVNRDLYATYKRLSGFTMISKPIYIANLKLAKRAASIPGVIVECGTWRGGMVAGIARVLGAEREYWLFDSFEGLPKADLIDGAAARKWQENIQSPEYYNNCTAAEKDALAAMSLAGIANPHLVKGWFENTLPVAQFSSGIALLRMDADWYKSTKQILDSLFPFVNEGGLILIDDYYVWDGCSRAVHDYLSCNKRTERIACYDRVCFIMKKADGENDAQAREAPPAFSV